MRKTSMICKAPLAINVENLFREGVPAWTTPWHRALNYTVCGMLDHIGKLLSTRKCYRASKFQPRTISRTPEPVAAVQAAPAGNVS